MTFSSTSPSPPSPLATEADVVHVGTISVDDLIRLYHHLLGVDIRHHMDGVAVIDIWRCLESDLVFFDPPVTGDSAFYAALSRFSWYYQAEKFEFDFTRRHLEGTERILEVGCGPGFFGRSWTGSYTGLETSTEALAKSRSEGLDIRQERIEDFAAAHPEGFDAVVSFQVLEHVAEPALFLDACVKALKPGGLLVVSVPSADGFMSRNVNDILNLPPHHVTWWSRRCLNWVAHRLGLEMIVLHVQGLSDGPHRRWFCKNLIDRAVMNFIGVPLEGPVTTDPLWFKFQPLVEALAGILQHGYDSPAVEPAGHTVIAIMRKPVDRSRPGPVSVPARM